MSYYIIQYTIKLDGVYVTSYHKNIKLSRSQQVMNVYAEHLTKYASKARKFYDRAEAERIGQFFSKPTIQLYKIVEL